MEREYHKKLRWQIILTILAFSVIPLLILGAYIYYQFSQSYYTKIMEDMKTLAENRSSSIDLFLDERVSQLSSLAHIIPLDKLRDEAYLEKVFDIIQARSKSYLDLGIIDQEGRHLAYVGPYYALMKSANYQNEDWFHKVMSTGVYVSDVFLGFRKIPHFIIAVRVREGSQSWILGPPSIPTSSRTWCGPPGSAKRGMPFSLTAMISCKPSPGLAGPCCNRRRGPISPRPAFPRRRKSRCLARKGSSPSASSN